MKLYKDKDFWVSALPLIIAVVLVLLITLITNLSSASTWNEGVCPHCEVRYELRGVSEGLKYYSCPICGQEVEKF